MLNLFLLDGGISGLTDALIHGWIGPLYILAVAAYALTYLKNREFRAMFSFIGIALIVGLCVFSAAYFFGAEGVLTKVGKNVAGKVKELNYVFPHFKMLK